MIPGPIGAAAAGISAGAYAATGNRAKALMMGVTVAAAMVPGGGAMVKVGMAAAKSAGKVSARAGRAVVKAFKGGGSCRVPNSFTPETGVLMADGSTVPIGQVQVGDLVAARDPETGELTAQPVLDVIVGHGDKHLIKVVTAPAPVSALAEGRVADDDPRADTWTATANHPIWVDDEGWTEADDLALGDLLMGAAGEYRVVQDLDDQGWLTGQTVYNLSVANVHTFVVGDAGDGTVVHNCGEVSKANSPVWASFKPWRGQTRTNGKMGKSREYYEWDHTHRDIEVYNGRGVHKGSMHPKTGKMHKPAVVGRRIRVR
ncbi:hypothetical protein GCU49_21715 [Modestobacter roseus]|nr:hypothetical protein [Modestobacter roseus]